MVGTPSDEIECPDASGRPLAKQFITPDIVELTKIVQLGSNPKTMVTIGNQLGRQIGRHTLTFLRVNSNVFAQDPQEIDRAPNGCGSGWPPSLKEDLTTSTKKVSGSLLFQWLLWTSLGRSSFGLLNYILLRMLFCSVFVCTFEAQISKTCRNDQF